MRMGRPTAAHVFRFEANVGPIALSGVGGCCATCCAEARTNNCTYGATNGSADYATCYRAACAASSLIGRVVVSSAVAAVAVATRGVGLKADVRPVAFGGISHSCATGCSEACADDSADRATYSSARESACDSATSTTGGLVGRIIIAVAVVIALAVVIAHGGVAVRGIFCGITDCFARTCANGSTDCGARGNADWSADCAEGPTDYSACSSTGSRSCDISSLTCIGCGCHASACRATDGRADTSANGTAYYAADDPTGNSATRATHGLTCYATLIRGCAIAVVGVVVHLGVVLNVTRAVVVENVTRHAFLAVGHAGCYQYATASNTCFVQAGFLFGHTGVYESANQSTGSRAYASAYQRRCEGAAYGQRADTGDCYRANSYEETCKATQQTAANSACNCATSAACVGHYFCGRFARLSRPHRHAYIICIYAARAKLLNRGLRLCGVIE
jgi:hypothetical protein